MGAGSLVLVQGQGCAEKREVMGEGNPASAREQERERGCAETREEMGLGSERLAVRVEVLALHHCAREEMGEQEQEG